MSHHMSEAVHLNLTVGNTDFSGDYGPGDVDLPEPVAELLTAMGFASESKGKPTTKNKPEA